MLLVVSIPLEIFWLSTNKTAPKNSLKLRCPLKRVHFKRKGSSSKHFFWGNGSILVFRGVGPAAWIAVPHRGSWLIDPLQVHGKMTCALRFHSHMSYQKKGQCANGGLICVNDVCRGIIGDYIIILCYILLASMMEWYEYEMKQWWYCYYCSDFRNFLESAIFISFHSSSGTLVSWISQWNSPS